MQSKLNFKPAAAAPDQRSKFLEKPISYIQNFYQEHAKTNQRSVQEIVNKAEDNVLRKHVKELLENSQTLSSNFEGIPNVSRIEDDIDLAKLNHKVVRFDCIISDMFDEEYFISVVKSDVSGQEMETDQPAKDQFIYKYFTEIEDENINTNLQHTQPDGTNTLDRANLLGTTIVAQSPWTAPNQTRRQCLLKLYDDDTRKFKLLDVVTFIGILEFKTVPNDQDSQMTDHQQKAYEDDGFGEGVPNDESWGHIHVLDWQRNYIVNNLPQSPVSEVSNATITNNKDLLNEACQKIKAVLTLILNGDKQAAEYCLISLISRIHKRETVFLMGNIALNLTDINSEQAQLLQKFMMNICPLLSIFDSNVEALNDTVWQPVKDYNLNKLNSSILGELPTLSNLLIDETSMSTGQLNERGLQNVAAMTQLIEEQQIIYDFKYSKSELPVNVSVLVIGEGRTLFKNTLQMPVITNKENKKDLAEVKSKLDQVIKDKETINQMRKAMLVFAHHYETTASEFKITEEVSSHAQNIFIQVRQKESSAGKIETDDDRFHKWLTLARYISIMQGDLTLSVESFDKAVQLELTRVERCPKPPAATEKKEVNVDVDVTEDKENMC